MICTDETQRLLKVAFIASVSVRRKSKGIAEPVHLFRVESIAFSGSLIEAGIDRAVAADGRDHEISLLHDRWEQAQDGMGQVVSLQGEAGLGKSV